MCGRICLEDLVLSCQPVVHRCYNCGRYSCAIKVFAVINLNGVLKEIFRSDVHFPYAVKYFSLVFQPNLYFELTNTPKQISYIYFFKSITYSIRCRVLLPSSYHQLKYVLALTNASTYI